MKLSVIIPCFNAANTIATQLEALAKQEWDEPWEVIVSNNGSTDETLTIIESYERQISTLRIVDSSGRRGAAHARNIGVSMAKSDNLAFCDADDKVAPGWVAAIGEALQTYDFVASSLEWEALNPPWAIQGLNLQRNGVVIYANYLPAAASWGLGVKRYVHEAVGGFDETMLRLQDVDYCWKIQQLGIKLHGVPEAVVHYRFPSSFSQIFTKARLTGKYEILLQKNYGPLGMAAGHSLKSELLGLKRLVRQIPVRRCKGERAIWLRQAGYKIGRLQGRIEYRLLKH